jgi:membrane-associated phospholipid phosphatase
MPVFHFFLQNKATYQPIGNILSTFGLSTWYISASIFGFIFFRFIKKNKLYEQRFLFLFYVNIFSGFLSILLKFFFGRLRPWRVMNEEFEQGFLLFNNFDLGFIEKIKYQISVLMSDSALYSSFPSGHTTTIFALFSYCYLLFPRYIYLWMSLAIMFAGGRVLASDHFVSDVLGGILLGTLSTMFIYSKMREKI